MKKFAIFAALSVVMMSLASCKATPANNDENDSIVADSTIDSVEVEVNADTIEVGVECDTVECPE